MTVFNHLHQVKTQLQCSFMLEGNTRVALELTATEGSMVVSQ